ncbi:MULTISPECIES: hypothetical protein [unclassified Nonomuraea]|uniref:hypothetical protein n=1 Tax=unclassified Nonomuraea TaxID=2593643 RepID=UPI0033C3B3AD
MTAIALTDARILFHGYDFTGDANQVSLTVEADDHDATTFGSARATKFRSRVAGLKTAAAQVSGFWGAAPDLAAWTNLAVADRVAVISPTGNPGDVAYMLRAGVFSYEQMGEVGEPAPFTLGLSCTNTEGAIRGRILATPDVVLNATGVAGIADLVLPAVAAGQFLYGSFQVVGTPGTTITAVVESAAGGSFAGATTRITFGPVTTTEGRWAVRVPGPITDTHYRLRVTAVTGSFTVAAAIGIGS